MISSLFSNSMLFSWISAIRADPGNGFIVMVIQIVSLLGALILHEISHGYMALWCGDPTAKMLGRLSLNPSHHLDPIGTTMMLLVGVGYAKPVPVNPNNFRHYRRDDLLVSLAGITMNLILFLLSAFFMALTARVFVQNAGYDSIYALSELAYARKAGTGALTAHYLFLFFRHFASLNLGLALFNLLPIPPLDGYHVLNDTILKGRLRLNPELFRIFQIVLIALLVFTNVVGRLLGILMNAVWNPVIEFFFSLLFK